MLDLDIPSMLAISHMVQHWFFSMNVLIWSLSTSIGLLEHGLSFSENLDKIFQTTLKQQCFDKVSQKVSFKVSFDKVSFIILEIIKHNMPKCYFFLSSSIIKWLQWIQQCMHKTFWMRSLSHYPSLSSLHHCLVSGQKTGREHSHAHQQKIGLKIYWAWPHPLEQDRVSPSVSPIRKLS